MRLDEPEVDERRQEVEKVEKKTEITFEFGSNGEIPFISFIGIEEKDRFR